MISFYIALGYFGLMSLVTFSLYVLDKKKAKRGSYRIPEKVLLLLSFFGGALGGLIAMYTVRHKTKREHWYFTFVNVIGLLLHVAALVLLFIYKPF